jgi:hypothetical protein
MISKIHLGEGWGTRNAYPKSETVISLSSNYDPIETVARLLFAFAQRLGGADEMRPSLHERDAQ